MVSRGTKMAYLSTFGFDRKWVTSTGRAFLKWKPPFLTPENERAENFTFRHGLDCFKNFKMADKSFSQPIFTKLSLRRFLELLITNLKSDLQNSKWRIQDGKQFQLDGAPAPNLISAKNFAILDPPF